jgi:hypothetical protein
MTTARERLLERLNAAEALCASGDLLDVAVTVANSSSTNWSRQYHRRGVMVGCFAAFEDFLYERTREIAQQLTLAGLPISAFPQSLVTASQGSAVSVLSHLMSRESGAPQASIALQELAASWSSASGGGWTVPHASLLWAGSNISATTPLNILQTIGTATEWTDITGVVQATGVSVLPTKAVLDDIAKERHKAAHDAGAPIDVIALTPIPKQLLRIGFAFDALLSVGAARILKRSSATTRGRGAVTLTRLVSRSPSGDSWAQFSGPPSGAQRAVKVHRSPLSDAVQAVASAKSGTDDVVLALEPDVAGKLNIVTWASLGI